MSKNNYDCVYIKKYKDDSLIAVARHDTTLITLKTKSGKDTILNRNQKMCIKDIKIFENKCIIVYESEVSVDYLVMIRSPKWAVVCGGMGYGITALGEVMENRSAISTPSINIMSDSLILVSEGGNKQFYIEVDYLNKTRYRSQYITADSFTFIMSKAQMMMRLLSRTKEQSDTIWKSGPNDTTYIHIDTIVYKNGFFSFVSSNRAGKHLDKLSYTYRSFQWNGQRWVPILEKNIGLYRADPKEVKEVKHIAYNQVRVTQSNGQKTLIEYNLEAKTEKRTNIRE